MRRHSVLSLALLGLACHRSPGTGMAVSDGGVDASVLATDSAAPAPVPDLDAGGGPPPPPAPDGSIAVPRDAATIARDAPLLTPDGASVAAAQRMVEGLSLERFRANMREVSSLGDRVQGSPSYDRAGAWLEQQLTAAGYTVEHLDYTYQGGTRREFFVTKVGAAADQMYIVGSHIDGRGGGGAFDDNGSGVSLVLELARAFAPATVQTAVSVRFAFFDNEETGMDGSHAYVLARAALQGKEDPPGSGKFPEPRWLGMLQHDMLLYDHGMPPGPVQSPSADIDVEYQSTSRLANQSSLLADSFSAGAGRYGRDYPIQIGPNMRGTDSTSFQDFAPSISVRENQRATEIEQGSNPNHHQPTDIESSYSDADFHLGFTIVKASLGVVAELAGARMTP
jgi:hypothetical protein